MAAHTTPGRAQLRRRPHHPGRPLTARPGPSAPGNHLLPYLRPCLHEPRGLSLGPCRGRAPGPAARSRSRRGSPLGPLLHLPQHRRRPPFARVERDALAGTPPPRWVMSARRQSPEAADTAGHGCPRAAGGPDGRGWNPGRSAAPAPSRPRVRTTYVISQSRRPHPPAARYLYCAGSRESTARLGEPRALNEEYTSVQSGAVR